MLSYSYSDWSQKQPGVYIQNVQCSCFILQQIAMGGANMHCWGVLYLFFLLTIIWEAFCSIKIASQSCTVLSGVAPSTQEGWKSSIFRYVCCLTTFVCCLTAGQSQSKQCCPHAVLTMCESSSKSVVPVLDSLAFSFCVMLTQPRRLAKAVWAAL